MAAIDRAVLIAEVKFWLPAENKLTDESLTKIAELIISRIGDDDTKFPEILCKTIEAAARKNLADYTTTGVGGGATGDRKREKAGGVEIEYYSYSTTTTTTKVDSTLKWQAFIDSLKDLCPLFGYSPPRPTGRIKVFPGKSVKHCGCDED